MLLCAIPAVWRAKQKQLLLGQFARIDLDSWMIKFCVLQTYKVIIKSNSHQQNCLRHCFPQCEIPYLHRR
ncbi:hypothetical protein P8452_03127 [Trifolium repens]|nr:hypothetical protein P8452_03127 [Trifolium repens]